MEKCLKTNVLVKEVLFSDSAEQPIDIDFTLPDYCKEISRIFKCQSAPRISSKSINGKNITVEGVVTITLLYAALNGELCSYEYQYPFSKTFEASCDCVGMNLVCKAKNQYLNCRAITGRKVDIHGAVGIYVTITKRKSTEIVSDYDDKNVELKRGMAAATVPMGSAEKYILIEEEIDIGQGQPQIRNVWRSDVKACVKETKVINDKAVIKGEIKVCIIYCSDSTPNPQSVKTTIPFSQILDIEGITDSCACDTKAEVVFFEIKPRISASGETKSFSLTAKLLLNSEAYCSNEIPVIFDAFSRKYEADIKKTNVVFERITQNISENYHCKKAITFDEEISSVVDLWCNIEECHTKFENENMIVYGTVLAAIIVCDTKNIPIYHEKQIEFEHKFPLDIASNLHCEPQIEVTSCGFTITSTTSMELMVDILLNAAVYQKSNVTLISEMNVDTKKPCKNTNRTALTIYFCGAGECVWDIARIYNASVEEIMAINELENEQLENGKMILVPII